MGDIITIYSNKYVPFTGNSVLQSVIVFTVDDLVSSVCSIPLREALAMSEMLGINSLSCMTLF